MKNDNKIKLINFKEAWFDAEGNKNLQNELFYEIYKLENFDLKKLEKEGIIFNF